MTMSLLFSLDKTFNAIWYIYIDSVIAWLVDVYILKRTFNYMEWITMIVLVILSFVFVMIRVKHS
jgi:hypothetical protein